MSKKGELFKVLREKQELKSDLKSNVDIKKILKDHVNLIEGVSDNGLVSLVVRFNGYELNEECVHELKLFKFIDGDGNLTQLGKEFIEKDEVISRLKNMVE